MNIAIPAETLKTALTKVRKALLPSKSPRIITIRATPDGATVSARIRDGIIEASLPETIVWKAGEITLSEPDLWSHAGGRHHLHVSADSLFTDIGSIRRGLSAKSPAPTQTGVYRFRYPVLGATPPIPTATREPAAFSLSSDAMKSILSAASMTRPLGDRVLEWQHSVSLRSDSEGTTVMSTDGHRAFREHLPEPVSEKSLDIGLPEFLVPFVRKYSPKGIIVDGLQWWMDFDSARIWYPVIQSPYGRPFDFLFKFRPSSIRARFSGVKATDEAFRKISARDESQVSLVTSSGDAVLAETIGDEITRWTDPLDVVRKPRHQVRATLNGHYIQDALKAIDARPDTDFQFLIGGPYDPVRFDSPRTKILVMPICQD